MISQIHLKKINELTQQLSHAFLRGDTLSVNHLGKDLQMLYSEVYGSIVSSNFGRDGKNALDNMLKNINEFSAGKVVDLFKKIETLPTNSVVDFENALKPVENIYNNVWLKTELDSTQAQSIMAKKWDNLSNMSGSQTGILMLKYVTSNDDRVRDEHAALDGIVRPMTDPFWNTHMVPNGWGCRCNIVASRNFEPTPLSKIPKVDIPSEFQMNSGKQGIIFNDKHPYMSDKKGINNLINKNKLV